MSSCFPSGGPNRTDQFLGQGSRLCDKNAKGSYIFSAFRESQREGFIE